MCLFKLRNVINIDMYMVNTQNRMISMKYFSTFGEKFEDIKMGNKLCYFNLVYMSVNFYNMLSNPWGYKYVFIG
jgi:hypothetical protein